MWDHKYKILFLGSSGSGKSTIISGYSKSKGLESPTVGITVSSATVIDTTRRTIPSPVRFYDMGGSRYWWPWIPDYLTNACVVFIFYDVTRPETLVEADEILEIIKEKRNNFRTILVGNKTDLESERKVNIWDINKFIGRHNSTGWSLRHIECNSKNLISFKKMMDRIVYGLTKIDTPTSLRNTDFNLDKSVKSDGMFGWILSWG